MEPALPSAIQPQMGYLVKYLFNVRPATTQKFRNLSQAHAPWAMVWEAEKNVDGLDDVDTLALFAGGRHAKNIAKPPQVAGLTEEQCRRKYIVDTLNKMRKPETKEVFAVEDILSSVFMDYPQDKFFGGGYSCPGVGEVTRLGEFLHTPFQNKVYFAGEFACRYKWNGFMEGALISGAGAAKEILKSATTKRERSKTPINSQFSLPTKLPSVIGLFNQGHKLF